VLVDTREKRARNRGVEHVFGSCCMLDCPVVVVVRQNSEAHMLSRCDVFMFYRYIIKELQK